MSKVTCDCCKGMKYFRTKSILPEYEPCPKCLGSGELDWLEKLFGKICRSKALHSVHLNGKIFWVDPENVNGELGKNLAEIMELWKKKPAVGENHE